ncbi:PHD-finger family protein [Candida albicans]|uniref:PHD-finger family protein n=1 Tax=Candida albicans TaxID=5476 RepID=A0A8H6C192_CANAX|nr:PHD-finger family protein [Candida albicans]
MSQTTTRPRRKATINKSYNDSVDLNSLDYDSSNSVSTANSTQSSGSTTSGSRRKNQTSTSSGNNGRKTSAETNKSTTNGNNINNSTNGNLALSNLPNNWQSSPRLEDYFSFKLDLSDAYIDIDSQTLFCPNQFPTNNTNSNSRRKNNVAQFSLSKGQYIYMISEPPGEPYYIGRIMGFKHKNNNNQNQESMANIVDAKNTISNTMVLPTPRYFQDHIGLTTIDIEDEFNSYVQKPNQFYFDKLFDRYMIKFYDVLSTANLLQYAEVENSKSRNFLIALNKRYDSNTCNCESCGQWCENSNSIQCVVCEKYFHMFCLDPPMSKKPSRGFSWSCAPYNKSSNKEQLARELSVLSSTDNEYSKESTPISPSPKLSELGTLPKYEMLAIEFLKKDKSTSFAQRRIKEEWCMRYLGQHARLEDGVDVDDRSPYPRASTRIGTKHQATYIPECDGHPLVYYDVDKPQKKKNGNGSSSSSRRSKSKSVEDQDLKQVKLAVPQEYADVDPKEYPAWLQPRPKGYIERGVDDDHYVGKCSPIAESIGLSPNSPNFVDAILYSYMQHKGNVDEAFKEAKTLTKKSLKEPIFSKEKSKDLRSVFYYLWKKTKNGREIWGNFEGRIQKKVQNIIKEETKSAVKVEAKNSTNTEDDSSYEESTDPDDDKKFICKHCNTLESTQWFKITGHDAKKKNQTTTLYLYVLDVLDYGVDTSFSKSAGGWKKKVEIELLEDAERIIEHNQAISSGLITQEQPNSSGSRETKKRPSPSPSTTSPLIETYRERQLTDVYNNLLTNVTVPSSSIELPFEPSERNCCICREHDNNAAKSSSLLEMLICSSCGVNVHASCAGIKLPEGTSKPIKEWLCEPCINDLRPIHSAIYSCSCCLANESNYELSILGSPFVRPDFLKPIGNGRCLVSIVNIDKIFLNNHRLQCEICQSKNGALIKCELCDDNLNYHVTCAQDTPNFKLGFKLVDTGKPDINFVTLVDGDACGKLKPILVCPKHDQSKKTILSLRTYGKRMNSKLNESDYRPLVELYLQDLINDKNNKRGKFSKSMNYIENYKQFFHRQVDNGENTAIQELSQTVNECSRCSSTNSPIWWTVNSTKLCQSCYHSGGHDTNETKKLEFKSESESVKDGVFTMLNGENYGIKNELDKLDSIYKPNITELQESDDETNKIEKSHRVESVSRSKISLGDILS